MKRKGSRMSMARSFEQQMTRNIPEDNPRLPSKQAIESSPSQELGQSSKGDTIMEETEDELATEAVVSGTSGIQKPLRKDEGLGESFDQQSEMSDSGTSLNSRAVGQNGAASAGSSSMKGKACDTVEEEKGEESIGSGGGPLAESTPAHSHEDIITELPEGENQNSNNANNMGELMLNPATLSEASSPQKPANYQSEAPGLNSWAKVRSRSKGKGKRKEFK